MSTWLNSDWITEPSKVFPVVKPHIMDPNGKSSKGCSYLNALPVLPPHAHCVYELTELCIFGNGDEGEIPVDAMKWSLACQPTTIHITDRAMQSLEERLRYYHTFRNFDTKWDEWAASRSILLTAQWIRLDVRRRGNSCHCTSTLA
jgi:hypothetical protein